jgi:hypothetical protein
MKENSRFEYSASLEGKTVPRACVVSQSRAKAEE